MATDYKKLSVVHKTPDWSPKLNFSRDLLAKFKEAKRGGPSYHATGDGRVCVGSFKINWVSQK